MRLPHCLEFCVSVQFWTSWQNLTKLGVVGLALEGTPTFIFPQHVIMTLWLCEIARVEILVPCNVGSVSDVCVYLTLLLWNVCWNVCFFYICWRSMMLVMVNCHNHHLDRTSMVSVRLLRLQGKRCWNWGRVSVRSGLNETAVKWVFSIKVLYSTVKNEIVCWYDVWSTWTGVAH